MPRYRPHSLVSPHEQEISRLKDELDEARRDILGLMPREVSEKLQSFYSCESHHDYSVWMSDVVDFVTALAKPIPEASYLEERARCPLCGSGGNSPYTEGYKIPGGLELHLTGSGSARSCPVMNAVRHLALNHLKPRFEDDYRKAQDALAARRKTETVFQVDPFDQPRLLDEAVWLKSPRDPDGLMRAETRLKSLGFDFSISDNIKTYRLETDAYAVYADPRTEGRISFALYRKPLPKKRDAAKHTHFNMPDFWKNELVRSLIRS
jgi:hypothetical protein